MSSRRFLPGACDEIADRLRRVPRLIVCAPTDAIVTFRKSGIDALFMDDVVLTQP
jgi:hypothetical protein